MELLHWQNLIFLIPLVVGLIFALGTACGIGGDHDHDIDADHDLDLDHDVEVGADVAVEHDLGLDHGVEVGHDAEVGHDLDGDHDADAGHGADSDHDHDADKSNPLDAVRQQRYRDPAWLKALAVIGVGKAPLTVVLTVLNLMFGGLGMAGNLTLGRGWFWLTLVGALFGAIIIGGRISNAVGCIVPKTESYCAKRNDLVGKFGKVLLKADGQFGQIHVRDQYGNLHRVLCRTTDGQTIPVGQPVVVVSYDEEKNVYLVTESELEQTA